MNLEKQTDFVATVTGTDVKKDQTTIHCITNMESYGRVRFSVTVLTLRFLHKLGR